MYNVYAYYSSVMFVYFNCLLFKSIYLLPFLHLSPSSLSFLFFLLFPLTFSPPSLLVRFPTSLPFHSTPFFFSYPSILSNVSISSNLIFPSSSPSFLFIPPFLARLLPVQPLISFLFFH